MFSFLSALATVAEAEAVVSGTIVATAGTATTSLNVAVIEKAGEEIGR